MANVNAPQKRDKEGLMPEQRLMLQELSLNPDWRAACAATGVSPGRFRGWMNRDPAWRAKFEEMFSHQTDAVRRQLEVSASRATDVIDTALDATKDLTLELKCPHCEGEIKVTAEMPDWGTRMKAAEVTLKVAKVLKDVKEVSGTVTVEQLPLDLKLALAAHRMGRAIPPGHFQRLEELNFIKQLPQGQPDYVEGEYHAIDSADE